MQLGLSNKDQKKISDAFSSLGEVCGNMWDNIFDDTSGERIKELEKEVWNLEEQVDQLKGEREKYE